MELVNEYVSTLSFLPVECYTVQHSICNNKQSGRFELRAKTVNVKHNDTLIEVNINLL